MKRVGKLTFRQFGVDKMTHWDVDWGCMLGHFAMDYCRGDYRAMPHQDNSTKHDPEDYLRAAEEAYEEVFGDSISLTGYRTTGTYRVRAIPR